MAPSICRGLNFVSPLKAMDLRISLRRKALASQLLRSPPGVCLCSSHQTTKPLRGTLAMAEARWMSEVDVALNDESQQHGNLDCMAACIPGGSHHRNQ